jgi:hypothetical protein
MRTQWYFSLSIAAFLGTVVVSGQSLRDLARQRGGKVESIVDVEYGAANMNELMASSDLVLRGHIADAKVHLRQDESAVVTDYVIAPIQVFKQRRPTGVARPGETTEIVVRRPGGRLVEGGLEMTTSVNIYPESESFKVGEDVVLFLVYNPDGRVYNFAGGPFGACRVQDGRVYPMTRATATRRGDQPVDVATFLNGLPRSPQ